MNHSDSSHGALNTSITLCSLLMIFLDAR